MIDVNLQKEYAHYMEYMSQYKEVMDKRFFYIQEKVFGEKAALSQAAYIDFLKREYNEAVEKRKADVQ